MKRLAVHVVCSDPDHPIQPLLADWVARARALHDVHLVRKLAEATGGDLLLLISCHEIARKAVRDRYLKTLVIHASDLPRGRGWSPYVWQVLEGAEAVKVTLLEAEDAVDSGAIWAQTTILLTGTEVFAELNAKLFAAELELMDFALTAFETVAPRPQSDADATYYRKRTPADSQLDPARPLADLFDAIRVADPVRYPAFFTHKGRRFALTLTAIDDQSNEA